MIGEDDVRYVAKLARLRLEQADVERMTGELAKILSHIDKMSELDTADVPPTAHVLDIVNVMRADKARPGYLARRGPAQRSRGERRFVPRAQDELTMTTLDPLRLTAKVAKRLLVDGQISSAELAKVYLDQIAAVESRVQAFILVTYDNAAKYSPRSIARRRLCVGLLRGCPSRSRTTWSPRAWSRPAPPRSCATTCRSTRRPRSGRYGTTTSSCWARPTWTSSPWAPPPRTPASRPRGTLGTSPRCRAAPAAAPPPPWPPGRPCGRSAAIRAAPSASRRPSAALWG